MSKVKHLTSKAAFCFPGFTFIELLIVITLMAIVSAGVSASYLTFEKNHRMDEAKQAVISIVRQAQNNATSGKKPVPACASGGIVEGWVLNFTKNSNNIGGNGLCSNGALDWSGISVTLPTGITIGDILYNGSSVGGAFAYAFFRPVSYGASFHNGTPLMDINSGDLMNIFGSLPQNNLTIVLSSGSATVNVVISPNGSVQ